MNENGTPMEAELDFHREPDGTIHGRAMFSGDEDYVYAFGDTEAEVIRNLLVAKYPNLQQISAPPNAMMTNPIIAEMVGPVTNHPETSE